MIAGQLSRKLRDEARSADSTPERLAELAELNVVLARLVAANEATPGEMLEQLSGHADRAVRRRTVSNPSTPGKVVAQAGGEFPNDLMDNPAFDLYLIENPDLLKMFGETTLRALLKREHCPASFFAYAAESFELQTALAILKNPSVPRDIVETIRSRESWWYSSWRRDAPVMGRKTELIQNACDLHVAVSRKDRDLDWRAALESEITMAAEHGSAGAAHTALAQLSAARADPSSLARDSQLIATASVNWSRRAAAILEAEFEDDERERHLIELFSKPEARFTLACSQSTPPVILRRLMEVDDPAASRQLITNPAAKEIWSLELLEQSARRANVQTYYHWKVPANLLVQLAPAEHPRAAAQGARNATIFPDHLLSPDAPEAVRSALASNRSAPADVLTRLAVHDEATVRRAVVENRSTSREILAQLAIDAEQRFCNSQQKMARWDDEVQLAGDLEQANLELRAAGSDEEWTLELFQAAFRELDEKTLSGEESVLVAVASNPRATAEILERLVIIAESKERVLSAVAEHPHVADQTVARLVALVGTFVIPGRWSSSCLEAALAKRDDPDGAITTALWAARSSCAVRSANKASVPPAVRDAIFVQAAHEGDEELRAEIAGAHYCPGHLIEKLATDAIGQLEKINRLTTPELLSLIRDDRELREDDDRYGKRYKEIWTLEQRVEMARGSLRWRQGLILKRIAGNPATTPDRLSFLYDLDREMERKARLAKSRGYHSDWFDDELASNPGTPLAVLRKLARSCQSEYDLGKLIDNEATPDDLRIKVYRKLASMSNRSNRGHDWLASGSLETSVERLRRLTRSWDKRVRRRAKENLRIREAELGGDGAKSIILPEVTPQSETLKLRLLALSVGWEESTRINAALASHDPDAAVSALRAEWLDKMTESNRPGLSRLLAFLDPDCPPGRLAKAQRSTWWPERCAIAQHPKTPQSALRSLANDGNVMVRAAAREAIAARDSTGS